MGKFMSRIDRYVVLISIDGMRGAELQETRLKMPVLRRLIAEGVGSGNMTSVSPTATWAIHTSMVTGQYPAKHGVLGNWVIDRERVIVGEHFGDITWGKESVLSPTIFDIAKQCGWTTATICWPKTRGASTIDWNIPEFYRQELFDTHCTPELWTELIEMDIPVHQYAKWSVEHAHGPMQDWLTTKIATHLIDTRQPNLLLLHYLLPDSFQHDFGVGTDEVIWSLEYIDERIGEVICSLEKAGIREKTDLFVVSDHGFADTKRLLYPNVLFKQHGWFESSTPLRARVAAVSNGGTGFVYVLEHDREKRARLLAEVRELLEQLSGIGRVFTGAELSLLGLDHGTQAAHHVPDIVFEAEIDVFVHYGHEGNEVLTTTDKFKGMHGYLADREQMKALFAASGPSIRAGVVLEQVRVIDIAPTVMRLIGGRLRNTDGRALDEIWKEEFLI